MVKELLVNVVELQCVNEGHQVFICSDFDPFISVVEEAQHGVGEHLDSCIILAELADVHYDFSTRFAYYRLIVCALALVELRFVQQVSMTVACRGCLCGRVWRRCR